MALHSAGDLLHWHPHIHALTLYGGIDPQGGFWPLDSVDTDYLTQCFSNNLFDALLRADQIDQSLIDLVQGWQHSGFNVFVGDPIAPHDADARQFIGRYLKKSAVSNSRLELLEDGEELTVRIHKVTDDHQDTRDLDPLRFLAELAQHVPARREQTVRYFGKYSARSRGAERLALDAPGPLPLTEMPEKPDPHWARSVAKVFEFDPLECPQCGGVMKIKAFIHSSSKISRLCKALGLQAWRAPPPFKHKPSIAA